jgi:hypothetical protein
MLYHDKYGKEGGEANVVRGKKEEKGSKKNYNKQ